MDGDAVVQFHPPESYEVGSATKVLRRGARRPTRLELEAKVVVFIEGHVDLTMVSATRSDMSTGNKKRRRHRCITTHRYDRSVK